MRSHFMEGRRQEKAEKRARLKVLHWKKAEVLLDGVVSDRNVLTPANVERKSSFLEGNYKSYYTCQSGAYEGTRSDILKEVVAGHSYTVKNHFAGWLIRHRILVSAAGVLAGAMATYPVFLYACKLGYLAPTAVIFGSAAGMVALGGKIYCKLNKNAVAAFKKEMPGAVQPGINE